MSLVPSVSRLVQGRPRKAGATQAHRAASFPAPTQGLDVTQQLVGANPLTAIRLENLIPRVYGCALRAGYKRWASNLDGEVCSLMPYVSPAGAPRLFAATVTGKVYDVSTPTAIGDIPPIAFTPTAGVRPGVWSYIGFTTGAGVGYLVAVCQGAGMWVFDGSAWTQVVQGTAAMQIEGVDPAKFDYVWVWKRRLWFIEAGTTKAWYLPVDVVAGKATAFDFGPMMPHGGELGIGTNWTVDAGDGIDDKLVLVGELGDVLIYGGTDPDDASKFQNEGRWYIGKMPKYRRSVSRYSSDVMLLSERGLVFLTELLRGQGFFANATLAQRINPELAKLVQHDLAGRFWELRYLPQEQLIVINMPTLSARDTQFVYEVNTKAFCTLVDMPMLCVETYESQTMFGDGDGNVWLGFNGASDGAIDETPGKDLEGTLVSAFMDFGEGYRQKIFNLVRPSFLAGEPPAVQAAINPDWNFTGPGNAPIFTRAGDSIWDTSVWSQGVWAGAEQSYAAWTGASGIGYYGALAMKVKGVPDTTFVSWQAIVTPGGVL